MADGKSIQAAWRDLGRRLADLRQARSLTQEEFARLMNASRSTLGDDAGWERRSLGLRLRG